MPAEVTAVIGNYEGEALLADCVDSLQEQSTAVADIVVVDASSTDRSAEVARRLGARVVTVENRGLGYLYNRGVETASSEFVLLLNNDVALDRRCVELLCDALSAESTRFAADARQMSWQGDELVHARAVLTRGGIFRELLPGLRLDMLVPARGVVSTVTANGGAMLVRRSMFQEIGGFDESFFMDFEDLDLCWRAWLRGWASVYVPDAWLRHRVGAVTNASMMPRRLASSHHNLTRFALKCLPWGPAISVIAGEILRMPAHPRPILRGLADVVRELPEILRHRRFLEPDGELFDWMINGQQGLPPAHLSPVPTR